MQQKNMPTNIKTNKTNEQNKKQKQYKQRQSEQSFLDHSVLVFGCPTKNAA